MQRLALKSLASRRGLVADCNALSTLKTSYANLLTMQIFRRMAWFCDPIEKMIRVFSRGLLIGQHYSPGLMSYQHNPPRLAFLPR